MGENHTERPREFGANPKSGRLGGSARGREVLLPQTPAQRETDPPRQTLTEAEEEGVHAHAVHAEEPVGDEVGAHDHRLKEKLCRHATTWHLQRAQSPSPSAGRRKPAESRIPQGKEEKRTGQDCSDQPDSGQKASATTVDGGQSGQHRKGETPLHGRPKQRAYFDGDRENTSNKEGPSEAASGGVFLRHLC